MGKPEDDFVLGYGRAKSTAKDIYAALKESTASPQAKIIDRDYLELKQSFRRIIERGTEKDLAEALAAMGIGAETPEGEELLAAFRELREEH